MNAVVEDITQKRPGRPEKLFPVRLLKNYRPMGRFLIVDQEEDEDGNVTYTDREPQGITEKDDWIDENEPELGRRITRLATAERLKVFAHRGINKITGEDLPNTIVKLPKDEANMLFRQKIGERFNEEFE